MKWLGGGESTEMLNHTNGHAPQMIRQSNTQVQVAPGNSEDLRQISMSRSQEDGMVGYFFQHPQSEPEYTLMQHPPQPFEKSLQQPQLAPMRWALGDDVLLDHHQQQQQHQQHQQHQQQQQQQVQQQQQQHHHHHSEAGGEPMMFPHGPHHLAPPPGIIPHHSHMQMSRNGQMSQSLVRPQQGLAPPPGGAYSFTAGPVTK